MAEKIPQTAETPFLTQLEGALRQRGSYIGTNELPRLKEEFKCFHTGLSTIYSFFVSKGYITEDPYKQDDAKTGELCPPENTAITDNNRRDQLGRRLSSLDNQFDFLCNFFPITLDSLSQETIKQILALLHFVEWNRLSRDSKSITTAAIAEVVAMARRSADNTSSLKMNDALQILESGTEKIMRRLKTVNDFNRESYKYDVRKQITTALSPTEETVAAIKTKFENAMPGQPFYKELVEEIIQEDGGPAARELREAVFQRLKTPEAKEKTQKKIVSLKPLLIQGLNALGSGSASLTEIMSKMQENHGLLQTRKKKFFERIALLFAQLKNKESDSVVYTLEIFDPVKSASQKTELNFSSFSAETDKKARILAAMTTRGAAAAKLDAMDENQLVSLLKKNLRDVFNLHKTLAGLDDYFKQAAGKDVRDKIKGVKPELSALKNAHTQANQKLADYESEKETAEQYKKLGIPTEVG